MVCLGLEDFTFAEVIDSAKIEQGKSIAKIGIYYTYYYVERTEREKEIRGRIGQGYLYSSKYFIENPNSNDNNRKYY